VKNTRLEKYGQISSLLSDRGKVRVLSILEAFALQGNLTVWELTKAVIKDRDHIIVGEPPHKKIQSEYGTFHKAVVKLLASEYIAQQGTVRHSTHKKGELLPVYGLTTKGVLVTMVISEKARQNWKTWVRNAIKDEVLPQEMRKLLSYFIEYDASQLLFLKFFVDPNERLVTSMFNMDAVDAKTFGNACLEKWILAFEEGRFNPIKNLTTKDKAILMKIYRDTALQKIREDCLDFLKQEYSERLQKIDQMRKTVS